MLLLFTQSLFFSCLIGHLCSPLQLVLLISAAALYEEGGIRGRLEALLGGDGLSDWGFTERDQSGALLFLWKRLQNSVFWVFSLGSGWGMYAW